MGALSTLGFKIVQLKISILAPQLRSFIASILVFSERSFILLSASAPVSCLTVYLTVVFTMKKVARVKALFCLVSVRTLRLHWRVIDSLVASVPS